MVVATVMVAAVLGGVQVAAGSTVMVEDLHTQGRPLQTQTQTAATTVVLVAAEVPTELMTALAAAVATLEDLLLIGQSQVVAADLITVEIISQTAIRPTPVLAT
jgi:hypothetical protein